VFGLRLAFCTEPPTRPNTAHQAEPSRKTQKPNVKKPKTKKDKTKRRILYINAKKSRSKVQNGVKCALCVYFAIQKNVFFQKMHLKCT
jgi:hypothetical protein